MWNLFTFSPGGPGGPGSPCWTGIKDELMKLSQPCFQFYRDHCFTLTALLLNDIRVLVGRIFSGSLMLVRVTHFGSFIATRSWRPGRSGRSNWSLQIKTCVGWFTENYNEKRLFVSLCFSWTHAYTWRTGKPGVPGNPLSPFKGTIPITPPGSPCKGQNKSVVPVCHAGRCGLPVLFDIVRRQLTLIPGTPGMPWNQRTVISFVYSARIKILVFRYCFANSSCVINAITAF